jgi:hypothetical protein
VLDGRRFLLSSAEIAAPSGLSSSIAQARVVTESEHNPLLLASYLASFDELKRAHE